MPWRADHSNSVRPDGSPVATFQGDRNYLGGLIFWNTCGTFLTFGFYRFWARNRMRGYFWNHVRVAGEPAEYLGRGFELFIGFLLAFGFVLLIFAVLAILGLIATAQGIAMDRAQLLPYALLLVLLPVALFRARRYRLSRTAWRSIRFGQDGSTGAYTLLWVGLFLMTLGTFGLAYPWRNAATERYRANHTFLGNRHFRLDANGFDLFRYWLPVWLAGLAAALSAAAAGYWQLLDQQYGDKANLNLPPMTSTLQHFYNVPGQIWLLLSVTFAVGFFIAFVWYRTAEFRYFLSRLSFGKVRFHSQLEMATVLRSVLPFAIGVVGYIVVSAIVVSIVLKLIYQLPLEHDGENAWVMVARVLGACLAVMFFASFAMSLLFNLTMRYYLIQAVGRTMTIENLSDAETVRQTSRKEPRYGEGLADAFDLGSF